jgi:hypothetical protein
MSHKTESSIAEAPAVAYEPQRVLWWRREQFHELGFTLSEAYALADAPVDLSTARRLIAAGCPRQTAIRILL